ncbi:hypothetical protein [Microbacterium maritypicum]
MTDPATTGPDRARRLRLIISLAAAGIILAILTAIGIYGLVTGPPTSRPGPTEPTGPTVPAPPVPSSPTTGPAELPPLPETTNPERFAEAAAEALFVWDTFTTFAPDDHRAVLLAAADPSGTETPGLISDLSNYLPSAATWRDLQEYRTAQWIDIDRLYVPDQWYEAVAAADGQLADGLIAYTVEGTRHREGVWFDEQVTSQHAAAFTMFLSCPPATDRCVLLRLSQLDKPLR